MKPQYTMLGEYWAMMGAGHVQDWEHRPGGGVAVTQHAHPAVTAPLHQAQGVQQLQPGTGVLFKQDNKKLTILNKYSSYTKVCMLENYLIGKQVPKFVRWVFDNI